MGSLEKLEYGCTTTNLPVCNGAIIVLKITQLYSISVITNFLIPNRDKQKNRQLEINMHNLRGNAIPGRPCAESLERF